MQHANRRSVEEIVAEVARFVPADAAADLTNSIIESAKWAFRALKSDAAERHVCQPVIGQFMPINGVINLPVETLRVVDVAMGRMSLRESVGSDGRFTGQTISPRYTRYGTRIVFDSSKYVNAPITITYWKIPTDDRGRIEIPDELFMAVVFHVAGKEALGRAASNPQLFAMYDRMKIEAGNSIDFARANMNSAGWNEMLDFMASIRRNYNSDYDL